MSHFPMVEGIHPCVHAKNIQNYFAVQVEDKAADSSSSSFIGAGCSSSYFICFTNRCGSNLLASAIASDGQLKQAEESLNFKYVINRSRENSLHSLGAYLTWLADAKKSGQGIFGSKASVGQLMFLYEQGLLEKIGSEQKYIHIMRKDVVGQAISMFIASKTGGWTSEHETRKENIEFSSEHLVRIVQTINLRNKMFSSFFSSVGVQPMVLYYEDLLASPNQYVAAIGKFLGVEGLTYVPERVPYKKQANELNAIFKSMLLEQHPELAAIKSL